HGDVNEFSVVLVLIKGAGGGVVGDVDVGPAVVVEISGQDPKTVGAVGVEDGGFFGDVAEGAVAIVVIEDVFSTFEARGATGDHDPLIEARAGFGNRCGGQVQVDVVGDEKVEVAVAIVVDEGAAGVPALAGPRDTGPFRDVSEGAVAIVVIEDVFAEVGDEQVLEAVVVVIANANALSPAGVDETGFDRDVGKGAVAIVLEQMTGGGLAGGKAFEAGAVDEEDVKPAVVVVVVESEGA